MHVVVSWFRGSFHLFLKTKCRSGAAVAEGMTNEERTHGYSLLDGLRGSVLEALHPVDGPEVRGKRRVADVLVGHVEVALVTPPGYSVRTVLSGQVLTEVLPLLQTETSITNS